MAAADGTSHVLCLMGTRPEAIKMFPVVHALRASEWFTPVVITTGQHPTSSSRSSSSPASSRITTFGSAARG